MSGAAWSRVARQMIQMFGPAWTEKFGKSNEAWEAALDALTYSQVTAGLTKVRNGALKFYELDLPNFLELCKPSPPPKRIEQVEVSPYLRNLCEKERQCHYFANCKLLVWSVRHPKYGINGPEALTKEQQKTLVASTRRIAHDFFEMREELGDSEVPDSDFEKALHRQWERDVQ